MKNSLITLLILFSPLFASSEEIRISDFSAGMWSYLSPNMIPDNAASILENVYTDANGMLVQRRAMRQPGASFNFTGLPSSSPIQGMFSFTSSASIEYFISFASGTMYTLVLISSTSAGSVTTWNLGYSTGTRIRFRGTQNLGKIWFTNGINNVFWFDGYSTGSVSSAPMGELIAAWRNRIVIAASTSNFSTAYFSEDGDGTNWTLGGNPTDPFTVQIGGGADGLKINCLNIYGDDLIFGRRPDTWTVSGFDQADVVVRKISSHYGCIDQGSVQARDNSLIWFSNDRSIVEMRGITIKSISEPIRNYAENVAKNNLSSVTVSGSPLSVPMASVVFDGRYYLATTTRTLSSGNWNDIILCYQRNNGWTTHTGIRASAFVPVIKDSYLYVGENVSASNGVSFYYMWEHDSAVIQEDAGTIPDPTDTYPIKFNIETKSYNFLTPHRNKQFRTTWVSHESQVDWGSDDTVVLSYKLDRSTSSYSLQSTPINGETAASLTKFPFPLSTTAKSYGREIQLKITRSATFSSSGEQPKIYDLVLDYSTMEPN